MVVSPCRIEHPAFVLCANPSPRLFALVIDPVFQHRAVLFVVQMMLIGLIPTFKAAEAFHHGMFRIGDLSPKSSRAMLLKLCAH